MTTTENDIVEIQDLLTTAPIEDGKLGHHTVLNTPAVRVIMLAFERGRRLTEHHTPRPLLLQALDGLLRITAAGRTVELRPGGLLYLPASLPHEVEALEPSRLSLTLT
jgi:quercetin dioxygenase-like cupin family protein